MNRDLLYQLALTEVPQVGTVHAKLLAQHFGNAEAIFKASFTSLEKIEGIGTIRARNIKSFNSYMHAEKEIRFIEKFGIQTFFITEKEYPQRFLNCYDPPTLLYYKGTADLNTSKIVSVIGTRSNTDYGRHITEKLIKDLSAENVLVVSGLAFGIDAIAHKAALKNNLPTVGVVAHGLAYIYPPEHSCLAKDMVKNEGGILTEHRSSVKPDKHNFPVRNRIVAGISDATIVVETGLKGGSLITAELANAYNRDVFAFPGKISDQKSAGCNYLIKNNKAVLLTDGQQLIDQMGWNREEVLKNKRIQRDLFIELTKEEKIIVDLLNQKDLTHIDEIHFKSGMSNSIVAATLLNLELNNIITSIPGKLYKLGL